jgi:ribulose-5-phosphate 4-epimerase/fuculose-1-phosphate aldolase
MSFKQITVDDLIRVDHNGDVVEGTWPVNQAAFAIHSAIHSARPRRPRQLRSQTPD